MKADQVPAVDGQLCESIWKELETFMCAGFSSPLIARCKKKKMSQNDWLKRRDGKEWGETRPLELQGEAPLFLHFKPVFLPRI